MCTCACTDIGMLTSDVLDFLKRFHLLIVFCELCFCSVLSQFLVFLYKQDLFLQRTGLGFSDRKVGVSDVFLLIVAYVISYFY